MWRDRRRVRVQVRMGAGRVNIETKEGKDEEAVGDNGRSKELLERT